MKNIALIAAAAAVGLVSTASQAAPANFGGTASVTILEQIVISEDNALNFGKIDKPSVSVGSATYTISPAGLKSNTGDGSFIGNDATAGSYDFTGTDNEPATIEAIAGGCGGGLSLSALTFSTPSNTVTLDALNVGLGGTLTVPAATVAGSYTCSYTVSAKY
ncbi:DUF4402 domain-containing protein [Nevskia sp.]|uniref:DUF4402 domain-containing protein n=1 Tax=Nevskia sp. TaxID=1929292 RepID=UPI003F6FDEB2